MSTLTLLIVIFVAVIILIVMLRSVTGGRWDIRNTDIMIALIPIAFWLILSGKVKVLEFGGFKIEAAFAEAAEAAITEQVEEIPVDVVEMGAKGGVGEIPWLIERKVEALVLTLGHGGYYGPAIEEYLVELTAFPFLKYLVINNEDGTFFGMVDARILAALITSDQRSLPYNLRDMANWLNESDRGALEQLPGFLSAEFTTQKGDEKKAVLERMEDLGTEKLPVVDDGDRFVGMVDRSRLSTSLIVEVAAKVK
jgi:hypothetical protein